MREALARSDHDFVLAAPRRQKKASRRAPGAFMRLMGAVARHPGRTFACVVFSGLFVGIAANALFFQTARHPAPIFAGPVIARPAQPVPTPVPVPRQAEAPQQGAIAKLIETPAPAPQPQAAPVVPRAAAPAPAVATTQTAPKDQIGALLSSGALPETAADSARVLAVQKALVKMGYVLKPDGVMGATTRQALQMFEQSRKIPVTGDLSTRTLRELGSQTGIVIP